MPVVPPCRNTGVFLPTTTSLADAYNLDFEEGVSGGEGCYDVLALGKLMSITQWVDKKKVVFLSTVHIFKSDIEPQDYPRVPLNGD